MQDEDLPPQVLLLRHILRSAPPRLRANPRGTAVGTRRSPSLRGLSLEGLSESRVTSPSQASGSQTARGEKPREPWDTSLPGHVKRHRQAPLTAREHKSSVQPKVQSRYHAPSANEAAVEYKRKKRQERALKEQASRDHERQYRQRMKEVFTTVHDAKS